MNKLSFIKRRSRIIPPLVFLIISLLFVLSWFRFGKIYGGGDTGLPFYNPERTLELASSIWWDAMAPGIPVPHGLTSVPVMYLFSFPQTMGASPVLIQALAFFVLLFLMGYGMYCLSLFVLGKEEQNLSLIAGIFYLFTPYMMVQVWHRFIHNAFFFAAFMPFIIIAWTLWIRKLKPIFLFLFLFINFLAVYMYGTIAFIVTVWIFLSLITLMEVLIPWKGKKQLIKISAAFLAGLIFWVLTNCWWLIPTFSVGANLFADQHSVDGSLGVLLTLSPQTILPYTLQLANPFYLFWNESFGEIYQSIFFRALPWFFVGIVFWGLVKSLKNPNYAKWGVLLIIVIILSKGAAPPFNFPFIYAFSNFFAIGVIRNPFEKLGILLPIIYSILFVLGLNSIFNFLRKKLGYLKSLIAAGGIMSSVLIFAWPMFTGQVFNFNIKSSLVEVPSEYKEADNLIRKDLEKKPDTLKGNILHLPLSRNDDNSFKWDFKYSGVDPHTAFFTSAPSISKNLNIPIVTDTLASLSLVFSPVYKNKSPLIFNMIEDFNVRYIVLHRDFMWEGRNMYSPAETEEVLEGLDFLEEIKDLGLMKIYKVKDEKKFSKLQLSSNTQYVSTDERSYFWPWLLNSNNSEMISNIGSQKEDSIAEKSSDLILYPKKYIPTIGVQDEEFNNSLDNFNTVRILPNSPLYFLVRFKESLSLIGKGPEEIQQLKIIHAEKRLVETYRIKRMTEIGILDEETGNKIVKSLLNDYKNSIGSVFNTQLYSSVIYINNILFNTNDVFARHSSLLKQLKQDLEQETRNTINEITGLIADNLSIQHYTNKFPLKAEESLTLINRQLYSFEVPVEGSYELLMVRPNTKSIYPEELENLTFQVNDNIVKLKSQQTGDFMSFGSLDLKKGYQEISLNRVLSHELVPDLNLWQKSGDIQFIDEVTAQMSTGNIGNTSISHKIEPAFGGDEYLLNFQIKILKGRSFILEVYQNTDVYDEFKKEMKPLIKRRITPPYFDNQGWAHVHEIFKLSETTTQANLKIILEPWSDCLAVLADEKLCLDPKINDRYNRPSSIITKNISLKRPLNNLIFLRSSRQKEFIPTNSKVTELKIDRGNISGKIIVTEPAFLILKETFHPDWELELLNNKESFKPNEQYLANLYANAWFIDKPGDYNFSLEFKPENSINKGLLIALISTLTLIVITVFIKFRKNKT